jgi:hypothetical protein
VNKKKQKNFFNLGLGRVSLPALKAEKFFAPLFFKKAATFSFYLSSTKNSFPATSQRFTMPPGLLSGEGDLCNEQAICRLSRRAGGKL